MNETPVIIAGAGPTGRMMAALLSRGGVKVRVLDENEQQAQETRPTASSCSRLPPFAANGPRGRKSERRV